MAGSLIQPETQQRYQGLTWYCETQNYQLCPDLYLSKYQAKSLTFEWAARNKVKSLLFKCDVIPKVLQVFSPAVSKSLLTDRLLKPVPLQSAPPFCSKQQGLKGSKFNNKRTESEKKVQARAAVRAQLFWFCSPRNTLLSASSCRKTLSIPSSQAKRDHLSQCLWKSHHPFPSGLISDATLVWYMRDEVWHFLLERSRKETISAVPKPEPTTDKLPFPALYVLKRRS